MPKYDEEIKIPISIGIPIRVIKTPAVSDSIFRRSKKRFIWRVLRGAGALLVIFTLILSHLPVFSAFEAHVINVTAKICNQSEIKSMGYWKTHPEVYLAHLPQFLGAPVTDDIISTQAKVNKVFIDYNLSMRNKLRGQLLALKFNIAHFGIGEYMVEGDGQTLNEIVAAADFILRNAGAPNSELEKMKDLLDHLNNLEQIKFCSVAPPPQECDLQLTKTADSDSVKPGETITYHLTFDNVGKKVCTGGGVLLKDIFNKSLLKYIDYTSTENPKYFTKGSGYIEWNFGSIYPDDPLIEIDLNMKVASSTKCDSVITNSAKFWSNETNWGDPVSADSQVVCQSTLHEGILINEFLPNPVGNDKAKKPNGEWVELYNTSSSTINIAGWALYDSDDSHKLLITKDNTNSGSTTVPAYGFLVVYRNGNTNFALNNIGGDKVRLYDGKISDGANLIDSYAYTINTPEGKSFARIPDGSDNWVDPIPTPGEPNALGETDAVFGPALPEEDEERYLYIEDIINTIPLEAPGEIIEQPINEEATSPEEIIATSTEDLATTTQEMNDSNENQSNDVIESAPDQPSEEQNNEQVAEPISGQETATSEQSPESGTQISSDQQPVIEPAPAIEQQTVDVPIGGDGGNGNSGGDTGGNDAGSSTASIDSATL